MIKKFLDFAHLYESTGLFSLEEALYSPDESFMRILLGVKPKSFETILAKSSYLLWKKFRNLEPFEIKYLNKKKEEITEEEFKKRIYTIPKSLFKMISVKKEFYKVFFLGQEHIYQHIQAYQSADYSSNKPKIIENFWLDNGIHTKVEVQSNFHEPYYSWEDFLNNYVRTIFLENSLKLLR